MIAGFRRITCGSIYLFFPLTKYEPSLVKESSGDKKYYCIDYGLRSVLLNPQSEDNGKLLEECRLSSFTPEFAGYK